MKKGILLAITLLSLVGRSTAQDLKINVSDARFTAPLLEKLIKEYKKTPKVAAQKMNAPLEKVLELQKTIAEKE